MNIILIGMRGSGKTEIGKLLAAQLQCEFIETDLLIEQKIGVSIREIVQNEGWEKFRDYEQKIIAEVSQKNNAVIATGGGTVLKEKNMTNLRKNGHIIWLNTPVETLIERIGDDPNRPMLTDAKTIQEDMKRVMKERELLYRDAADTIIDADKKNIEDIVGEIMAVVLK